MKNNGNGGSQAMRLLRIFLVIAITSYALLMIASIELIKRDVLEETVSSPELRYVVPVVTLLVWLGILLPMTFPIRRNAIGEGRKTLARIMLIVRIFLIYAAVISGISAVAFLLEHV